MKAMRGALGALWCTERVDNVDDDEGAVGVLVAALRR
jgi:hypothetical protein